MALIFLALARKTAAQRGGELATSQSQVLNATTAPRRIDGFENKIRNIYTNDSESAEIS